MSTSSAPAAVDPLGGLSPEDHANNLKKRLDANGFSISYQTLVELIESDANNVRWINRGLTSMGSLDARKWFLTTLGAAAIPRQWLAVTGGLAPIEDGVPANAAPLASTPASSQVQSRPAAAPPSRPPSQQQQRGTPRQTTPAAPSGRNPTYKIYGQSGALTWELGSGPGGAPVVHLQAATRVPGQREYAWDKPVALMLKDEEVIAVLAVLLGIEPETEGRFHGNKRNKGFDFRKQGGGYYCSASGAEMKIGVPINATSGVRLAAHLLDHLRRGAPGRSDAEWIALIRAIFAAAREEPG